MINRISTVREESRKIIFHILSDRQKCTYSAVRFVESWIQGLLKIKKHKNEISYYILFAYFTFDATLRIRLKRIFFSTNFDLNRAKKSFLVVKFLIFNFSRFLMFLRLLSKKYSHSIFIILLYQFFTISLTVQNIF